MPLPLTDHPLRLTLADELHARPSASLQAPERASHLALLSGEGAGSEDRARVAKLCSRYDVTPPNDEQSHYSVDLGPFRLRWERHTEFSTYSFFVAGVPQNQLFEEPVLEQVPADWLAELPGQLLVGAHLELEAREAPERSQEALFALFGSDGIAGSLVTGGAAEIWLDFAIGEDRFSRILVRDRGLRPRQAGRLVQRLFEIETYRMLALLALPPARQSGPVLTRVGDGLAAAMGELSTLASVEDEQRLLERLTDLSAEVEGMAAATMYRFGAARAYYALVQKRVEELREQRVEGLQTVIEFIDRRLAPAMRTCEAVAERLEDHSERIARAGQLLRTRVEIELEAKNSELLRTMARRARLQLRLQQTVEGLSVVAISYYSVGLLSYLFKAVQRAGIFWWDTEVATALAIVPVVGAAWLGLRRLRRWAERDSAE